MNRARRALLVVPIGLALAGCYYAVDGPAPEADPPFHAELLRAAREYPAWGRVDDEMRFAPFYCREPDPAVARFSASPDADTHGRKLYFLFAKNRVEYILPTAPAARVGQVLVKEAWLPEEVAGMKPGDIDREKVVRTHTGDELDRFYPYATKGGKVFKASHRAGLFIMLKLDPTTPGTDDGWVYGTLTADGTAVTSAGKVESCMGCHRDAKCDRLFGLPMKDAAGKR